MSLAHELCAALDADGTDKCVLRTVFRGESVPDCIFMRVADCQYPRYAVSSLSLFDLFVFGVPRS